MIENKRNLRDKGYPNSREQEYITHTNLLMTDDVNPTFVARNAPVTPPKKKNAFQSLLGHYANIYNNVNKSDPDKPQARVFSTRQNYIYNVPLDYKHGIMINPQNDGRNVFVTESVNHGGLNSYSAAVDKLAPILGDNTWNGTISTPVGHFSGAYNGDVLYGTYKPPQLNHYLEALIRMLNRGTV